jgi:tetrapyrrole methylase family protein/MazG family protein
VEARPHITVVGLGPAGPTHLDPATQSLISAAPAAYLRTRRHPSAAAFDDLPSFDELYDAADSFDALYQAIIEELVAVATEHAPQPVVYAVPGSPLVAERTVVLLRQDPRVEVEIVPALSFLDLAWLRLGLDPLTAGVTMLDATQLASTSLPAGPALVAQCWSGALLSDIKLMVDDDREPPPVTLLHHLGLEDEVVLAVDWWDMDRSLEPDHLTSLYIPAWTGASSLEAAMADLEQLMRTLRAQCPWDRAQTHASLMPHLVEESYEVLDALEGVSGANVDDGSFDHLREELGDLLFQIVFHARLAAEEGEFTLADVARGIQAKLVHRHPHVFGDVKAEDPDQVVANWEVIKKQEKGRTSVTEGIPSELPALMLSSKLQRKARSVGVDPSPPIDVVAAFIALEDTASTMARDHPDEPLDDDATQARLVGQLLFALTDLARRLGVDPEQALRTQANELRRRILASETADGASS